MYIELVNEKNSHKMKIYAPIPKNKIDFERRSNEGEAGKIINFFKLKLKLKNAAGEKVFIIFVLPYADDECARI